MRTVAAAAAAPEVRCRAPRARCPDTSTPLACPPCPRAACRCVAPSFTRRCLRLLCAVVLCVVVCVRPEQPLSVLWAIKHHVASACVASKAPTATAAARRLRRWRRQHRQQLAARPWRVASLQRVARAAALAAAAAVLVAAAHVAAVLAATASSADAAEARPSPR